MTLQLRGGSYKVIQETQLKENNVRLLYPHYYHRKAIIYHDFQKIIGQDIVTCTKEHIIKWHDEDIDEKDKDLRK